MNDTLGLAVALGAVVAANAYVFLWRRRVAREWVKLGRGAWRSREPEVEPKRKPVDSWNAFVKHTQDHVLAAMQLADEKQWQATHAVRRARVRPAPPRTQQQQQLEAAQALRRQAELLAADYGGAPLGMPPISDTHYSHDEYERRRRRGTL